MDHRQDALVCAVRGTADLSVVEALVRLQLVARRRGIDLRVRATGDVAGLLELTGLDIALQPVGETEPREERCGVEEVVDVHHLPG